MFSYESNEWTDIEDETNSTLELVEQREENSGILYRCRISNRAQTIYTDTAVLTVSDSIAVSPEVCNVELNPETKLGTAEFSVGNLASALTYQWQVSADNGLNWSDISGATSQTLRLENVSVSYNGYKYRCVITTSDYSVKSLSGQIEIDTAAKIIFQPETQTVDAGSKVSFMIAVSGDVSYQWQKMSSGSSSWSNIAGQTHTLMNLLRPLPITAHNSDA